jgi:hypothetical protein
MKTLVIVACGVLIAAAILAGVGRVRMSRMDELRRNWKNQTEAAVAKLSVDTNWLSGQLASTSGFEGAWFTEHLLAMRNGEWMVYGAECQKANRDIKDIFIGRGSDGKWYYTTFHFCVHMQVLTIEPQPDDLASFVRQYAVREFDGRSDEALQTTWPEPRTVQ